jgi:thiamine kinase-like enzyme
VYLKQVKRVELIWDKFSSQEALEKAQILHRDISVGNILITTDGRGLLIDWDL